MSLREKRKESGLTQSQTAEKVGVTQSTVSAWENGTVMPSAALLLKLADLFDCSTDELLGRTPANTA